MVVHIRFVCFHSPDSRSQISGLKKCLSVRCTLTTVCCVCPELAQELLNQFWLNCHQTRILGQNRRTKLLKNLEYHPHFPKIVFSQTFGCGPLVEVSSQIQGSWRLRNYHNFALCPPPSRKQGLLWILYGRG